MLEIIAAIILGRNIKKIVEAKGLKPTRYILIMVALWVGLEFTGALIGTLMFGDGGMVYLFAIIGAIIGAYLSYTIANNAVPARPDSEDILDADDILDENV
jgi:hypothetical protein